MTCRLQTLCEELQARLERRDHAVIVVSEGARFEDVDSDNVDDFDVGSFMKKAITSYFQKQGEVVNVKYIDPGNIIRSTPANSSDSLLCSDLAYSVVHGVFAGRLSFTAGQVNGQHVWIPIAAVAELQPRTISVTGRSFVKLALVTGQPALM